MNGAAGRVAAGPVAPAVASPGPRATGGRKGGQHPPEAAAGHGLIVMPRLKPGLRLELVGGDAVFILSKSARQIIVGELPFRLLSLVDGRTPTSAIVAELRQHAPLELIYFHLFDLESRGVIEDAQTDGWAESAVALSAIATAARPQIACVGAAVDSVSAMARRLGALGAEITDVERADLILVLVQDYLEPELAEINSQRLSDKKRWVLANAQGDSCWIGPLFVPGETGCWQCLAERLNGHRLVDGFLAEQGRRPTEAGEPPPPEAARIHRELIAKQLLRAVAEPSDLEGILVTFDADSLATERHRLSRLAHCSACGEGPAGDAPAEPIRIESRTLYRGAGGALRALSAEATLDQVEHLVSPICGIVREVREMVSDPTLPATYSMAHIFVRKFDDVAKLVQSLSNVSGGKGRNRVDAKLSGICEAIERYSGMYHGNERVRRGRFSQMRDCAVDPLALLQFSDRQYQDRDSWNARHGHHQFVPDRLDPDTELGWTPAWSLRDERTVWLPTAYVYYGYASIDCRSIYADSNGSAAGNNLEEAILQGFFELAERDAVAIWWYNRLACPEVDLASFDDPFIDSISCRYAEIGREVWALDLTQDLGVPTFAALSRRPGEGAEDIIFGFGAHFDARVAISRAVSELHQCLPCVWLRQPGGETQYRFPSKDAVRWWREAKLADHPYLTAGGAEKRKAADYPRYAVADLKQAVEQCVAVAAGASLDFLVVDQSRSDAVLPVAKVVIPGLRHFWARFREGRLYNVPVALGRQTAPTAEADLNPWPMFL